MQTPPSASKWQADETQSQHSGSTLVIAALELGMMSKGFYSPLRLRTSDSPQRPPLGNEKTQWSLEGVQQLQNDNCFQRS